MAELAPNEKIAAKLVEEAYEHYALITECPLCGGSNEITEHVAYQTGAIYFIRCICGMMYQQYYFTSENLSEYYKTAYRSSVPPYEESVSEENILGEVKSSIRYMQFVSGVVPKRHLDIGSSTGAFLKMMRHAHGCESVGVEPGDIFREYSIKSGVKTVADISEIVGKYDLITMAHVLEHITKPLEMLSTVRDLLEDDGRLFVEVPWMSCAHSHPVMFNKTTIRQLINKASFDITETDHKPFVRLMMMAKKRRNDGTNSTRTNEVA